MLCLFLTFLHLSDCLISVGVLSLLFWWVAWWWYHCRTRHPWSWWPNPGPSSKYKIKIQIFTRSLLCSPRPSWSCPAPWLGRRPTAGGTQPRLSRCAPGPAQYSTVQYSTVQYSTWSNTDLVVADSSLVTLTAASSRRDVREVPMTPLILILHSSCHLSSSRLLEIRCWPGSKWAASSVPQQISSWKHQLHPPSLYWSVSVCFNCFICGLQSYLYLPFGPKDIPLRIPCFGIEMKYIGHIATHRVSTPNMPVKNNSHWPFHIRYYNM